MKVSRKTIANAKKKVLAREVGHYCETLDNKIEETITVSLTWNKIMQDHVVICK